MTMRDTSSFNTELPVVLPTTPPFGRESSVILLVAIAFLIFLAPFGSESSVAGFFVVYRGLLLGIGVLAMWCSGQERGPDFGPAFYAGAGGILTLMLLSVWTRTGADPAAWTVWYEHALMILFYVGLARFASRQTTRWKAWLTGIVIGCSLLHLGLELAGGSGNLGGFVNRNYLATYLLVGLACALAVMVAGSGRPWWRAAAGVSSAVLVFGISTTASRGATIAAAGVIGLAIMTHSRRPAGRALGIASASLLLIAVVVNGSVIQKFSDFGEQDPYNYDRIGIWGAGLDVVAENPLLGVGFSRFEDRARQFRFPVEGTIGRYMMSINIAHSEYLQYAAESGVPVLLLILTLVGSFITGGYRRLRSGDGSDSNDRGFETAAFLAVSGVACHALVDNVWTPPVVAITLATAALGSSRLSVTRAFPNPVSKWGLAYCGLALLWLSGFGIVVPAATYDANATARRHYQQQDVDGAVSLQRFAVALEPRDAVMLTNLGTYMLTQADLSRDPHTLDMAGAYFMRAIDANPELLEAREGYANSIVRRLSGDPVSDRPVHEQLITAYESMLTLDPFLPFVTRNLAEAYFWTGRIEDACQTLEIAIAMEPNFVDGYLKLAAWRESAGQPEQGRALRAQAAEVVMKYRNEGTLTDYESMLLGRGPATSGL